MRIALVAGETSGDMLGAGLIRSLKKRYPNATFEGIGGPLMQAQGMVSFVPMERLAVMGLVEVLGRLFELLKVRRDLIKRWRRDPPDVFIGIDAPDFNLTLEQKLRQAGIKTVHYVSPSVWAWRQGRVKGIRAAVDRMLTFLPFEASFYQAHQVPVTFVGHPLAEELPLDDDREAAREQLALPEAARVLAVLPGSRRQEIAFNAPTFRDAVALLRQRDPELQVVIPAANAQRRDELAALGIDQAGGFTVLDGEAWAAMTAADAVLLTSGTAALEAMLCHRPMVVAYRHGRLTHWMAQRLVKTRWISLPNLIAQEDIVPELIQEAATSEALADTLWPMLERQAERRQIEERFKALHEALQCGASERAARAVLEVAEHG